jgi:hypothetical protein
VKARTKPSNEANNKWQSKAGAEAVREKGSFGKKAWDWRGCWLGAGPCIKMVTMKEDHLVLSGTGSGSRYSKRKKHVLPDVHPTTSVAINAESCLAFKT